MSTPGPDRPARPPSVVRLERAVDQLLAARGHERTRAERAEAQLAEMEGLLRSFEKGTESPRHLQERVRALEEENADLQERLAQGRAAVERVRAKLRFMEERR